MEMLLVILLPILMLSAIVLITRFEKRMVWPYGAPEPYPQFADIAGYGEQWVRDATRAGFTFLGWSPDLKGPIYRLCYGFLVSPERDCIVCVGIGMMMKMPLKGTWIYTPTPRGEVFYTTDNQSGIWFDVTRRWRSQLAQAATFSDLLQRHRKLLSDKAITPQPFTAGKELEEFERIRREHHDLMARQGLIFFTDAAATHWHFTLWGAVKSALLNFVIGLVRAVTFNRIPRCA